MAILKDLIVLGNSRITSDLYAKTIYEDNVSLSAKYAPVSHTHSYLPLGGGTLTGALTINVNATYPLNLKGTDAYSVIHYLNSSNSAVADIGWLNDNRGNCAYIANISSASVISTDNSNAYWSNDTSNFKKYTLIHSGNYTSYVNTTNFPGINKTGTVTSVAISNGGGLSISGSPVTTSGTITISHSNSITAQTTQALYPIKIDANGHISAYGSAITSLPASDVYSWAKASTKPSYTLDEVSDGSTRKLANYLPLAGGTMTGAAPINFTPNVVQMNFRPGHSSYNAKLEYMTSGNEALVFATQQPYTSYMFVNGLDLTNRSDYGTITANPITMQLKSNKVSINRTIRGDTDPQTETLYVGGDTRVAGNNFYVGTSSGSQCHQQYDSTNECLKFLFD